MKIEFLEVSIHSMGQEKDETSNNNPSKILGLTESYIWYLNIIL